jgi:hypothetical protein
MPFTSAYSDHMRCLLLLPLALCGQLALAQQPVERITVERMAVRFPTTPLWTEAEPLLVRTGCPIHYYHPSEWRWIVDSYQMSLPQAAFHFTRMGVR